MPQSRVIIFRNEHTRLTSLGPKLVFWCVSFYLGAFGIVWLRYNTQCKKGQTGPKVRAQSHIGIFHNKRTRSTPLDSKLMFWCVLYYLDAFGTVWLPYKTQCKSSRTFAKVCATKSRHNFSQRTHLIDPFGTITSCFGAFHTIWVHLGQFVALQHSVQNGPNLCKNSCH